MKFKTLEVKGGCRGFAVARSTYFSALPAVEIASTQTRTPREATVRAWRVEAPPGFEFSILAPCRVTHPGDSPLHSSRAAASQPRDLRTAGHFRPNALVCESWEGFEAVANALRPRFIVFETPSSFYPNADHLRDMYRFFKGLKRGGASFVWEPRGRGWDERLTEKVTRDLGLILAEDPAAKGAAAKWNRGKVRYLRFAGRWAGRHLERGLSCTDEDLRAFGESCGDGPSYLFFGHHAMWRDAKRFQRQFPGRVGPVRRA